MSPADTKGNKIHFAQSKKTISILRRPSNNLRQQWKSHKICFSKTASVASVEVMKPCNAHRAELIDGKVLARRGHSQGLSGGETDRAFHKEVVLCSCSGSLKHHLSARHAPVGAFSSAATPPLYV